MPLSLWLCHPLNGLLWRDLIESFSPAQVNHVLRVILTAVLLTLYTKSEGPEGGQRILCTLVWPVPAQLPSWLVPTPSHTLTPHGWRRAGDWVLLAGRREGPRRLHSRRIPGTSSWGPQLFGSLVPGWLVGDLLYRFCTENMNRQGKQ